MIISKLIRTVVFCVWCILSSVIKLDLVFLVSEYFWFMLYAECSVHVPALLVACLDVVCVFQ